MFCRDMDCDEGTSVVRVASYRPYRETWDEVGCGESVFSDTPMYSELAGYNALPNTSVVFEHKSHHQHGHFPTCS